MDNFLIFYTDGACKKTKGTKESSGGWPGGWGWVQLKTHEPDYDDDFLKEYRICEGCDLPNDHYKFDNNIINYDYGGDLKTTNVRMEIMAVLKVLERFDYGDNLDIYTDNKSVMNTLVGKSGDIINKGTGYTGWIKNWVDTKSNWKDKKNLDLWVKIYDEIILYFKHNSNIRISHVKGHAGIYGNELADTFANLGVPE